MNYNCDMRLALSQVVLGGAEMTKRDWTLAEKHYSFLVPHIRHYHSLDEQGKQQLKELMDVKQIEEKRNQENAPEKTERKTWKGGHRSFGMTRPAREVYIFYFMFGGGVVFGCAVAEGYRDRWDELPFHP